MGDRLIGAVCAVALAVAFANADAAAAQQAPRAPQGETRCLLVGPLVVSGYLDFVTQVARGKTGVLGSRADRTNDLIDLYAKIGCDRQALNGALECLSASLVEGDSRQPVAARAQSCMKEAGMPVR